jgi:mRNA-degrading endonuclease toxin of MazEF toxin-antitoxin module
MNRGEIWHVDLGGKADVRPVLVVTRQAVIEYIDKVVVVEITTKGKGYPTEVFIDQVGNLPQPSFVQADNLHTVPKIRLTRFIGTLDNKTMLVISRKITLALGLEGALEEI